MSTLSTPRRAQRIQHEIHRRDLQVLRVDTPSPGFRAVTFGGDSLAGFVSASFDDHVKFIFTDAAGELQRRDYTPRHHDAARGELSIEFALHGHGPAAAWAERAKPGDRAVIAGPRGSFVIPLDFDWHLLVGDASALPAVARRLEELPAGCRAIVVLEVAEADRRALRSNADVDLHWVADSQALLATVRALKLPAEDRAGGREDDRAGEGFAWCAGEGTAMRALRSVLVDEHRLHPHAVHAAAYWKLGVAGHHERIDA